MFQQGDWAFFFDLKSGYHHIVIHDDSQTILGFSWGYKDQKRYLFFRVLPFGLSTACYVFTKLLRPLVKIWTSLGMNDIGCTLRMVLVHCHSCQVSRNVRDTHGI